MLYKRTEHLLFLFFMLWSASFTLSAQSYGDCVSGHEVCKKKSYTYSNVSGEGRVKNEADYVLCFMNGENNGQAEENSTWIKFKIQESGSLTFVITPEKRDNDLDFVVYRLPKDGDCSFKQIVRCMASGSPDIDSPCMGKTGLREGERNSSEDAGCNEWDDNAWLAPLRVVKDEQYVILVSNVTEAGAGFSIDFGGSAKLPCDDEPIAKAEPKPKKENKPASAPPAVVVEEKSELPSPIGGRKVEVGETIKVKKNKLTISIWDGQVVDGDVISIYLNDKKIVDHATLTAEPKTYAVDLPSGKKEHYLTVYADDFGKAEPNTAMVKISDGANEQIINLVAGRTKQESVKIVVE